jgi:hypothetical protein
MGLVVILLAEGCERARNKVERPRANPSFVMSSITLTHDRAIESRPQKVRGVLELGSIKPAREKARAQAS